MVRSAGSSVSRQGYADATDVTRPVGDSGSSRLAGMTPSRWVGGPFRIRGRAWPVIASVVGSDGTDLPTRPGKVSGCALAASDGCGDAPSPLAGPQPTDSTNNTPTVSGPVWAIPLTKRRIPGFPHPRTPEAPLPSVWRPLSSLLYQSVHGVTLYLTGQGAKGTTRGHRQDLPS